MKIYKYVLEITDEQELMVPIGAEVLSVGEQGGKLCMWFLVNPANSLYGKNVYIYGTGNPLPNIVNQQKFIGTVQIGPGVWHVFTYQSQPI